MVMPLIIFRGLGQFFAYCRGPGKGYVGTSTYSGFGVEQPRSNITWKMKWKLVFIGVYKLQGDCM